MTAEEKQTLLQFMGVTYGAAVKMDRDIVSPSNQLNPISESIKRQFERILPAPVDNTPYQPPPLEVEVTDYPTFENLSAPPVIGRFEQASSPLPPIGNILSSEISDVVIALNRIADILEKQYNNDKPTKPIKKVKAQ